MRSTVCACIQILNVCLYHCTRNRTVCMRCFEVESSQACQYYMMSHYSLLGEVTLFTNNVLQGFLSWGEGEEEGSRMIVAYKSTLTHACLLGGGGLGACTPPPPRKSLNLDC